MKTRLTPLNIISAGLVVAIIYPLLYSTAASADTFSAVLLAVLLVLFTGSDILFRSFLHDLKRIWIVEGLFIIFVAVLLLVIHQF